MCGSVGKLIILERLIGMAQVISRVGPEVVIHVLTPNRIRSFDFSSYQRLYANKHPLVKVLVCFDGFSAGITSAVSEDMLAAEMKRDWIGSLTWPYEGPESVSSSLVLDKPEIRSGRGRDGG